MNLYSTLRLGIEIYKISFATSPSKYIQTIKKLNFKILELQVELCLGCVILKKNMWQNHPNYMAHMCTSLSHRPLTGAHISHTISVVYQVSSGNPESSTFYNSYKINMELPQHYNICYKNIIYWSVEDL